MARIGILFGAEPTVAIRDLARSSRGRHELVFVCSPDVSNPTVEAALGRVGDVRVAPREDWTGIVAGAAVDGLTTFDDALVDELERITEALGLAGRSDLPQAWDKLTQRQALNDAGASHLHVLPVSSMEDLADARLSIGPAGVLKPRRSSTSRGVVLAAPKDATSHVWEAGQMCENQIFEEMMDLQTGGGLAPFVSVETVSVGLERVHFAGTDKLPLLRGHLETGHVMPSRRDDEQLRSIYEVVTRALDALGVRDRITHTEVGLTSSGPQVIEVNGRLGGFVHGLTRRSSGLDACRLALDVAVGCADHAFVRTEESAWAAALLLPLETDRESDVEHALQRLRNLSAVRAVERSSPVSDHFRRPVAWLEASSGVALRLALADTVRGASNDEVLNRLLDPGWVTEVLTV